MDANKLTSQRSLSAEPQPVTDRLESIKTERLSITPNPFTEDSRPQGQARSLRTATNDKITPTAKVSAWLEALSHSPSQVDDEETSRGSRDAVDISASKLCSLQLQPISVDVGPLEGQGDKDTLVQRRGKAIPPITAYRVTETTSESENADDKNTERDTSLYENDMCSTQATIDSETSSTMLSSQNNTGSPTMKINDTAEATEQSNEGQSKDDFIIKVKEANETIDKNIATKQVQVMRKLFGRKGSQESGTSEAKPNTETTGKISFGGVASTLLQWKLNQARAVKRRSQSIAIDAKHFALMGAIADKIKTQLPRSLSLSVKEEARPILVQTVQAYKSEIGKSHRLTLQAQKRLDELTEELRKPQ